MDISANKQDTTPSSVSQTKVVASELNQLIAEQNNVITTGGELTPSSSDTTQLLTSIQKVSKDKAAEIIANDYDVDEPWEKPSDWIDIRSGALPNSVYFLVGHSADYTAYPTFVIYATVSNSGTYDVFVDGIKVATTASGSDTTIDWETTALDSGWEVTTPETLKSHIVRVSASSSSNKITAIKAKHDTNAKNGLLWVHFTTTTAVDLDFFCTHTNTYQNTTLLACTCSEKELLVSPRARAAFLGCSNLESIPVLNFNNTTSTYTLDNCIQYTKIKKLTVKNVSDRYGTDTFNNARNLEELIFENVNLSMPDANAFKNCSNLRNLPTLNLTHAYKKAAYMLSNCTSLQDTVLDFSSATDYKAVTIGAASSAPVTGLKGLTVSNEAPFDYAASPQLDVSYTGLSRAALVNLFNSMPYNVAYTKVGNPTIVDGVASGFSSDNYLVTNTSLPYKSNKVIDSYEISTKITIGSTVDDTCGIIGINNSHAYGFEIRSKIIRGVVYLNSSNTYISIDTVTAQANTTYYLNMKYTWDGTNSIGVLKVSTDNITWQEFTQTSENTYTTLQSSPILIGYMASYGAFTGSIDLNNTYIKVNGVPWFGPGVTKNLVPGGTVVGSPTITNGIASGFSGSKYIDTHIVLDVSKDFDIMTKANIGSFSGGDLRTIFTNQNSNSASGILLGIATGSSRLRIFVKDSSGTSMVDGEYGTTIFSQNTDYYFRLKKQGSTLSLFSSTDKNTWVTENEWTLSNAIRNSGTYSAFGRSSTEQYWSGSIDLNNTYIISDGAYVYRGMVPQVKTCSVIGCTGTSSLTADDKAIATSKGWALTVA